MGVFESGNMGNRENKGNADYELWTANCELPTADCRLWTVDCRLLTADCSIIKMYQFILLFVLISRILSEC